MGITLEYSDTISPAKGMSSGGKITLLPNLDDAETFTVMVNEVAHELMHNMSMLDTSLKSKDGSSSARKPGSSNVPSFSNS